MARKFIFGVLAAILLASTANAQNTPPSPNLPTRATYRYAGTAVPIVTANATDWLTVSGSTSRKVKVTYISLCGIASSSAAVDVAIVKRSTADSAGTAQTAGSMDSGPDPAATASVSLYTANPTLGNLVAMISAQSLGFGTPYAGCVVFDFGKFPGTQPVSLYGPAQEIAVNFGGVSLPAGASIDWVLETTEE
jgi:hypothetical protein